MTETAESNRASLHLRIAIASVVLVVGFGVWWVWSRPEQHKHCIKAVQFWLLDYAAKNGGNYPVSERGWADALLKLSTVSGNDSWIPFFVGVDDHGELFKQALRDHADIPEEKCTRIYVQGLGEKSNPSIAILFDRYAIQGGDHWRGMPGQPKLREVVRVDGSHEVIKEANWPSFVAGQKELLKREGFAPKDIDALYRLTETPRE